MDALINSFQLTLYCATVCLKQGMLCSLKGADTAFAEAYLAGGFGG